MKNDNDNYSPDIWTMAVDLVEESPMDFASESEEGWQNLKLRTIEMIARALLEREQHGYARARSVLEKLRIPFADEIKRIEEEDNRVNWV